MTMLTTFESEWFRALNRIVEPSVRAGCGSPGILPFGLIVLETKGWSTGRWHRTPHFASAIDDYLLVSTVRGRRSHWVKNLIRHADVRYWSGGQPRQARALLFSPDGDAPDLQGLSPLLSALVPGLAYLAKDLGCAFAFLAPERSSTM